MLPYNHKSYLIEDTLIDHYWKTVTLKSLKRDIENGADVNFRYKDKTTPLVNACRYNNDVEIIKILLENGAEIEPKGCTFPLKVACEHSKNPEIVLLLLEYGAEVNPDLIPLRTPLDYLLDNKHLVHTAAHNELLLLGAEEGFSYAPQSVKQSTGKIYKLNFPKT